MDLIKAEIDISALRHNFRQVRKLAGRDTLVCAVIKDNAYGHGLLPVAAVMADEGADSLAVADLSDAEKLRSAGFKLPILNISGILPCQAADAVKLHVSQTVSTFAGLLALEKAAKKQNKCALVHIEVDCGMGRLGVPAREFSPLFEKAKGFKNIFVEGIFTHFPSADTGIPATKKQAGLFRKAVRQCPSNIIYHSANSAALINCRETRMDMVRPGLMLYGLYPEGTEKKIKLKPALSLKTSVIMVKKAKKGDRVSYNGTYRTMKDTELAALPIGYGDGFSRLLSNTGEVIIRGKRYPVAGRVCMDLTMLDIGKNSGIKPGDEATLIGKNGGENITASEIALKCKTIPYEVVCGINKGIKRIYF